MSFQAGTTDLSGKRSCKTFILVSMANHWKADFPMIVDRSLSLLRWAAARIP